MWFVFVSKVVNFLPIYTILMLRSSKASSNAKLSFYKPLPVFPETIDKSFFSITYHFRNNSAGLIRQRHISEFVTWKITIMKQVEGLQKQRLWSHFSNNFYKICIYGKLTTRHISLYMYCRPQYKIHNY